VKERKRPGLIDIDGEVIESSGDRGTLKVVVYNSTATPARHAIGIESDSPVTFVFDGKVLVEKGSMIETMAITVPANSAREFMIHWRDFSPGLKFVNIVARFGAAKTGSIFFG
jgi:hypothetical protein